MSRGNGRKRTQERQTVHCAIYTRVSTPGQDNGDFTSIDNQREACEAYIASQKGKRWVCLPDHYDDVGVSGGTLDRPALFALLQDLESGRVKVVVCYKLDRLSRSLSDFTRLMDEFKDWGVAFVSVTESFATDTPVGRFTMGLLATFAEFERATIAQRTSDKMSAARRRGRWTGGVPVLGYCVHLEGGKLVVNQDEADQVRTIFAIYIKKQSLLAVVEELNRRGWTTKRHVARTGKVTGGGPWTKTNLHHLLVNPIYIGCVRHRGEVYEGAHDAVIEQSTWDKAQALLQENRQNGGARAKNRYGHLLRGLLHCSKCGTAYSPSVTKKNGRVYRYYVCSGAQKTGWHTCPKPSLQAKQIEDLIVDQIRHIGKDTALVRETVRQVQVAKKEQKPALVAEQRRLTRQRGKAQQEIRSLLNALAAGQANGPSLSDRLAALETKVAKLDRRLTEILGEIAALDGSSVNQAEVAKALSLFDPIWDVLFPMEQERIIQLLIERIEYDGKTGRLAIEFAPIGIKSLAGEIDEAKEEAS